MEREDEFDILPEQHDKGKQAPDSEMDEDVDVFTLDQVCMRLILQRQQRSAQHVGSYLLQDLRVESRDD